MPPKEKPKQLLINKSKDKTAEPANRVSRNGDELHYYMQNFSKYQKLSKEETIRLVDRYHQGDLAARDALIFHNMRLVAVIALGYWNSGVPLSDRIQLGVIGLMASLRTFDPKRSCLATYATPRIRSEISRGIVVESTARPFYVPPQMVSRVRLVQQATQTFWHEFGQSPSDEEVYCWIKTLVGTKDGTKIAEEITLADVVLCQDLINHGQWRSLDAPIRKYATESGAFAEIVPDPGDNSVEVLEENMEQKERLALLEKRTANGVISRQELQIIRLRADGKTFREVGKKTGRSRQRIQQLELRLVKKIRDTLNLNMETKSGRPKQKKRPRVLTKPLMPLNGQSAKILFAGKTMPRLKGKNPFGPQKNTVSNK